MRSRRTRKEAGLVVDQAAGTPADLPVDPAGLAELRAYLDQFWSKALVAYKAAVEQRTEESS